MSIVADLFNNCYGKNTKWEVVDFFIIGFFAFFGAMLMIQVGELSCVMNNYYSDGCYPFRDFIRSLSF